jgi:hypothetical protein
MADSMITGFRLPPWAKRPGDDIKTFPVDDNRNLVGPPCAARWGNWSCTRNVGHDGSHRAGTGRYLVAEWIGHREDRP